MSPHPARFPAAIPEFFIRMLTDMGDRVVDPFAGSCVTGEVAERLKRKWLCCDLVDEYLRGALARFEQTTAPVQQTLFPVGSPRNNENFYRVHHPASLWEENTWDTLPEDGGQTRSRGVPTREGHTKSTKSSGG